MIKFKKLTPARVKHGLAARSGWRTVLNRFRFGPHAPASYMRFKVSPQDVTERYHLAGNDAVQIHNWQTGQIRPGDWDLSTRPFNASLKFSSCHQRFLLNKAWKETPAWPYGLKRIKQLGKYDNCFSEHDLAERYALLDDLWDKTKKAKALPAALHTDVTSRTGILVHINRDGHMLFGNQGFHRLSIAKLAHLTEIVVVVGVVHPLAISTENYRALLAKRIT